MLEANGDVARFVSAEPVRTLHRAFAHHRASAHRGVNFITRAIEEAGVDEDNPVLHRLDTGAEVGRRAALFIHDADLDRVAFQAKQVLNRIEKVVGKGAFLRPVHLGLHNVDAAVLGVAIFCVTLDIQSADRAGENRVHDAFGNLATV